jgi:hypothetical protein
MTGACFDVKADEAQRIEDIFAHESATKGADFKFARALTLPELKEEGAYAAQSSYGYGGGSSYGGQSSYGGRGGQQSYGGRGGSQSYGGGQGGYGQSQSTYGLRS